MLLLGTFIEANRSFMNYNHPHFIEARKKFENDPSSLPRPKSQSSLKNNEEQNSETESNISPEPEVDVEIQKGTLTFMTSGHGFSMDSKFLPFRKSCKPFYFVVTTKRLTNIPWLTIYKDESDYEVGKIFFYDLEILTFDLHV